MINTEIEITIVTFFFTERNMDIYTSHLIQLTIDSAFNVKLKPIYDYDILLLMIIIICLLTIYYKENFYKFYDKYTDANFFYFNQMGDDFFYKKNIYSITTIIPIVIISLVLSLSVTYIVKDVYLSSYFGQYGISEFFTWVILSFLICLYTYTRLWTFLILGKIFRLTKKIINIISFDFLRVTIFLSFFNIVIFFISYIIFDFEFSQKLFEINLYLIVIYRCIYFFFRIKKIQYVNDFRLIIYILIAELFMSFMTLIFGYDQLRSFYFRLIE